MKNRVLKLIRTSQMLFDPDITDPLSQQLYDPDILRMVIDAVFDEEEIYNAVRQKILEEINLAYQVARKSGTQEDFDIFERIYYRLMWESPDIRPSKSPDPLAPLDLDTLAPLDLDTLAPIDLGTSDEEQPASLSLDKLDEAYRDMVSLYASDHVDRDELYTAAYALFDIPTFFREEVEKKMAEGDPATLDAVETVLRTYS